MNRIFLRWWYLAFVFVGTNGVFAAEEPSLDAAALAKLAKDIESIREQWEIPGVAVTIVVNDEIAMASGFGVRELGKPERVDEHTIFALSSMGKAFAAEAIATVVDQGTLKWDDPIITYLPWFDLGDPWVTQHTTFRDVLSHSSGIGDEIWVATDAPGIELVKRAKYISHASEFRTSYNYSNIGITIAGQAAAAAVKTDWLTLMSERLIRPLQMNASSVTLDPLWEKADIAPCYLCPLDHKVGIADSKHRNIVMPHVWGDGAFLPIPWRTVENIAPAGSINSNALDMANWLRMNLAKGAFEGKQVISEEAIREIHMPQNQIRATQLPIGDALKEAEDRFHFWAYGLGWRMNDYRGKKMVWHTGGITGFSSMMAFLPHNNIGVSVLANGWAPPDLFVYAITLTVFDAYLHAAPEDWGTELLEQVRAQQALDASALESTQASLDASTGPVRPLTAYTGRYAHPGHDETRIELSKNKLMLRFPVGLSGELQHQEKDTFVMLTDSPSQYRFPATFVLDEQGKVTGVDIGLFGHFDRMED